MIARGLDRFVEFDLVAIDVHTERRLERVGDLSVGDRGVFVG